jgi:hypothetical protein
MLKFCTVHILIVSAFGLCSSLAQESTPALNLKDITEGDPFFYTSDQKIDHQDGEVTFMGPGRPHKTHSQISHLPFYLGYMETNSTYRFVTVAEQVLTMIGEGKHGLWRVQENGMIREYLRPGGTALPDGADIYAPENQAIINKHYTAFLPGEPEFYRLPAFRVKDNNLQYLDLPITHPKYGGKYDEHGAIDLPNWFCTMSQGGFPEAANAMNFAFNQDGANEVGPLGKRAGLDVKENYTNVLRLEHFPDARSWVNVGQEGQDEFHVKWEAVDTTKTEAEYYLVERPFFNTPYLFLTAVFNNKDNDDFEYVRPNGPYYETLKELGIDPKIDLTQTPRFHIGDNRLEEIVGTPLYGVHHPNRAAYGGGGACPLRGGDWADYPNTSGGSGWPTQYEEVTPLCDGVLIDIKLYANLDGRDWDDPNKNLANAGVGTDTVTYTLEPGMYGEFTDPYLTENGIENPDAQNLPSEITLTFPAVEPPVGYNATESLSAHDIMVPSQQNACRPLYQDVQASTRSAN